MSNMQVKYQFHTEHIQQLEGILLTLADAAFQDREQRKAFKDLIRQDVWRWAIGNNEAKNDPENGVGEIQEGPRLS